MKKILLLIICLFLMPLDIKACSGYEVAISYPDKTVSQSCETTYASALTKMKAHQSNMNEIAIIKKGNSIVNANYAIAYLDIRNGERQLKDTDAMNNYYTTPEAARAYYGSGHSTFITYMAGTWGSEGAFLDYNSNSDAVLVKVSGMTGWTRREYTKVHPLTEFITAKLKLTSTNLTVYASKDTASNVIGTAVKNGEYEFYPSFTETVGNEKWYQINLNGQRGFIKADSSKVADTSTMEVNTYYEIKGNDIYHQIRKGLSYYDVNIRLGSAPFYYEKQSVKTYYLGAGRKYLSFDGNYFYNNMFDMLNDYKENKHGRAINASTPYFAYFMYTPMFTKSGYTAETFNNLIRNANFTAFPTNPKSYVNPTTGGFYSGMNRSGLSMLYGKGQAIIDAQNKYGTNALAIYSNAVRESATGTSSIAFYKNNLFGYGAADGNAFNGAITYETVEDSINFYAQKMTAGSEWTNLNNYRYGGSFAGNKLSGVKKQYASDPYAGESSTQVSYVQDQNSGGLDNLANTLGIKINDNIVNIYKEPDTTSNIIYQTKNYATGQMLKNLAFVVDTKVSNAKGEKYYRVFTDVILDENRNYNNNALYSFEHCYGYIREADLYVLNNQPTITASNVEIEQFKEFKGSYSATDFEDGDLTANVKIKGEVNTEVPGTYKITYEVVDRNNYRATKDVTVTVLKTDYPIFDIKDYETPQYVPFDPLSIAKAYDKLGDLSDRVTIKSSNLDTNKLGEYSVTYTVTNNIDLTTDHTIKVTVIPNEAPVINAVNKTIAIGDTFDKYDNVTATDKEDGNLTASIIALGEVNTTKAGIYQIKYSVTDKANQTTEKTITITVEEKKYTKKDGLLHIEKLTYNDKTKKLDFQGFLQMKGMHNLVSTVIKYDIIFENQFSGETYTKSLTRQTTGYPFEPPRDGSYQMTGSWFNEAIDLSNINDGNYTVYVRARSGDFETKLVLRDAYFNSKLARRFSIDGVGYQFRLNYYDRNLPLEFWVRKNGLISSTNTPTIDNMYNQVHEIKLVGSKLNIVGTSHNVKGNYAANQTVTRQIHLEKISDVSIAKTYNVGSITNGIYKVELAVSDGLEKTRAWYNTTLDISTLPIGEYAIIVQTKTGNIDDFGELYDIMFKQTNTSSIEGNRKYSIIKDETNRFRLLLKVEY